MILVLNESDRKLVVVYMGVEYELPVNEPVNIPRQAAQLYFAFDLDATEDIANLCIDRLKRYNLSIFGLPNKDVWDNYIQKVKFNLEVVKPMQKELSPEFKSGLKARIETKK